MHLNNNNALLVLLHMSCSTNYNPGKKARVFYDDDHERECIVLGYKVSLKEIEMDPAKVVILVYLSFIMCMGS
ncbi:hypothetical protein CR513_11885, partial [Mucuna pruriens]